MPQRGLVVVIATSVWRDMRGVAGDNARLWRMSFQEFIIEIRGSGESSWPPYAETLVP